MEQNVKIENSGEGQGAVKESKAKKAFRMAGIRSNIASSLGATGFSAKALVKVLKKTLISVSDALRGGARSICSNNPFIHNNSDIFFIFFIYSLALEIYSLVRFQDYAGTMFLKFLPIAIIFVGQILKKAETKNKVEAKKDEDKA